MKTEEIQTKATIAAALIIAGVIEVPTLQDDKTGPPDEAGLRLRRLTAYIYDLIVESLTA